MTRVPPTGEEREFIGPYLPIGEYGPYPQRLRQQFERVISRFTRIPSSITPAV